MTKKNIKLNVLEINDFKILHILTKPPRIEAKIVFERDNISQKLVFTLMELAHTHGFGCSPPVFDGPDDPTMTFLIGTILPTKRSLKKYVVKLCDCLEDIKDFTDQFTKQLDFTKLDLTMFGGIDLNDFYPEELASVRDQHYRGSWEDFYDSMLDQGKSLEASVVSKCKEFEEINEKDIGLVGHKLGFMLHMLDDYLPANLECN